jgi:hypothetical protein
VVLRGCVHSLDKEQEVGDGLVTEDVEEREEGEKSVSELEERETTFNDMLEVRVIALMIPSL